MINTKITLIEVGITSQDNLQSVECEKLRKYDMLANELGQMHKAKVKVSPFTWDGKYHDTYARYLGVASNTRTYCIVMMYESLSIDFRRRVSLEEPAERVRIYHVLQSSKKIFFYIPNEFFINHLIHDLFY